MKRDTKERLKYYSVFGVYVALVLCWLVSLFCISVQSFYWLRQNANDTQEVYSRVLKSKNASIYEDKYYYILNNPLSYIDNLPTSIINAQDKDIGFYFTHENASTDFYVYFTFDTDISIHRYGDDKDYNMCRVRIRYLNSYYEIYNVSIGYDWTDWFSLYDSDGGYADNDYLVCDRKPVFTLVYQSDSGITYHELYDNAMFDYLFFGYDDKESIRFNFNEMLNYNQILTYQLLGNNVFQYNGTTAITPIDISYYINLTFSSKGKLYRGLSLNASAVAFVSDNNGNVTQYDSLWNGASSNYKLTITSITYWDYGANTGLNVASLGVLEYRTQYNNQTIGSSPVWLTLNGFKWIDNGYKYITIDPHTLDNPTTTSVNYINATSCPFLSLTSYDALTFNESVNISGYTITDVGLSNVFTLMSSAFTGLAGLMTIQIIPGITLGLLCFIPLIVTIIIVVLRLVKK